MPGCAKFRSINKYRGRRSKRKLSSNKNLEEGSPAKVIKVCGAKVNCGTQTYLSCSERLSVENSDEVVAANNSDTSRTNNPANLEDSLPNSASASEISNEHFDENVLTSPSARKLGYFSKGNQINENNKENEQFGNTIMDKSCLSEFVKFLLCPHCFTDGIKILENSTNKTGNGLASMFQVSCSNCDQILNTVPSSKKSRCNGDKQPTFEVNRLAVAAIREIGCGQAHLQKFCSVMNLKCGIRKEAFAKHSNRLSEVSIQKTNEVLQKSAEIIREAYCDMDNANKDKEIIDIAVSFDGTWHRRGHRSHHGVGIAIELVTGLVIDSEALCTYCATCEKAAAKFEGKDTEGFKAWREGHMDTCSVNYIGTANSMESEAAKRIWGRSVAKYKFQYTTFLGDGDSKTYKDVCDLKPYGEECHIVKEECVNHVSKRMGTGLRNIIAQQRALGHRITGRGRLTQERILKIQNYYGRAIKDNSNNLTAMRNAVFAVLFHSISTDDSPVHTRCPEGPTSWCWWQRRISTGVDTGRGHIDPLPKEVAEKMLPLFNRLGNGDLLTRCLKGKTQNSNESLNSCIWQRCPKVRFAGASTVRYAVSRGIAEFNKGSSSMQDLKAGLYIDSTNKSQQESDQKDIDRINQSNKQTSKRQRKLRQIHNLQKARLHDKMEREEGATYASGAGDFI